MADLEGKVPVPCKMDSEEHADDEDYTKLWCYYNLAMGLWFNANAKIVQYNGFIVSAYELEDCLKENGIARAVENCQSV